MKRSGHPPRTGPKMKKAKNMKDSLYEIEKFGAHSPKEISSTSFSHARKKLEDCSGDDMKRIFSFIGCYELLSSFSLVCRLWNVMISEFEGWSIHVDSIQKWEHINRLGGPFVERVRVLNFSIGSLLVPQRMENLKDLKVIDAGNKLVKSLDFIPNLHTLSLESTFVDYDMAQSIGDCTSISIIKFFKCAIEPGCMNPISRCTNLSTIEFDQCNADCEYDECGYRELLCLEGISNMTNLKEIKLEHCYIDDRVVDEFRMLNRLKSLVIVFCRLHEDCTDNKFIYRLSLLEGLENLEVSAFPPGDENRVRFKSPLTKLELSSREMDTCVYEAISCLSTLTHLDLSYNKIANNACKHLSCLRNLKHLDISIGSVLDSGLSYLSVLTRLEYLNLSNNSITDSGIQYLSGMKSLRDLYLRSNTIKGEGLKHLSSLHNLNTLDVSNCSMGCKGAFILSQLSQVTSLDISRNNISKEGLSYISKMENLYCLDVSDNILNKCVTTQYYDEVSGEYRDDEDYDDSESNYASVIFRMYKLLSLSIYGYDIHIKDAEDIVKNGRLASIGVTYRGDRGKSLPNDPYSMERCIRLFESHGITVIKKR